MNSKNVSTWFKATAQFSIVTAVMMMGTLAQAGVAEESAGLVAQYCDVLGGMRPAAVAALKAKYCAGEAGLPTTNQEAAKFMLDLSHDTGTVRFANWSSLSAHERGSLETLEWDALNLSTAFVTKSVSEGF